MMVRVLRRTLPAMILALAALPFASAAVSSQTLKEVKDRGSIICGGQRGLGGLRQRR
jgi:hypothetical protein